MMKFGMPMGDPKYSQKGLPGLKNPNVVDSDEDIKNTLAGITTARKKARQQLGALELREEQDFATSSGKAFELLERNRSPEKSKVKNVKSGTKKNGSKARPQTAKPAPAFIGGP